MTSRQKKKFNLLPFNPNKDSSPNIAVKGSVALNHDKIETHFHLCGEHEKVKLPPVSSRPGRTDRLWEQTCFELFVTAETQAGYWEYNLSPSHDWAVFSFTGYRQDKTDDLSIDNILVNTHMKDSEELCLDAVLPLPQTLIGKKLQIGLSAVIQDCNDVIYYYALTHLGEQADFHDNNSFTISLNPNNKNS